METCMVAILMTPSACLSTLLFITSNISYLFLQFWCFSDLTEYKKKKNLQNPSYRVTIRYLQYTKAFHLHIVLIVLVSLPITVTLMWQHPGLLHIQAFSTSRATPHPGLPHIQGHSTSRATLLSGLLHIQGYSTSRATPYPGLLYIHLCSFIESRYFPVIIWIFICSYILYKKTE